MNLTPSVTIATEWGISLANAVHAADLDLARTNVVGVADVTLDRSRLAIDEEVIHAMTVDVPLVIAEDEALVATAETDMKIAIEREIGIIVATIVTTIVSIEEMTEVVLTNNSGPKVPKKIVVLSEVALPRAHMIGMVAAEARQPTKVEGDQDLANPKENRYHPSAKIASLIAAPREKMAGLKLMKGRSLITILSSSSDKRHALLVRKYLLRSKSKKTSESTAYLNQDKMMHENRQG